MQLTLFINAEHAPGDALDERLAARAAEAALRDAKPMSGNAYKIEIAKTLVKRALRL